jgi:transcriptional regulator with XRE-family HTH domain
MGSKARSKPQFLASKLRQIRLQLGETQSAFARRLQLDAPGKRKYIVKFETGRRQPDLRQLLQYARLGQVTLESLVDDEVPLQPHALVPACELPLSQPLTDVNEQLSGAVAPRSPALSQETSPLSAEVIAPRPAQKFSSSFVVHVILKESASFGTFLKRKPNSPSKWQLLVEDTVTMSQLWNILRTVIRSPQEVSEDLIFYLPSVHPNSVGRTLAEIMRVGDSFNFYDLGETHQVRLVGKSDDFGFARCISVPLDVKNRIAKQKEVNQELVRLRRCIETRPASRE